MDDLIIQHPDTGEEGVDAIQMGLSMGVDLIVWDSIAATQPGQEAGVQLSGGKNLQPATLARLMSVALRRLNTTNKNTAILCINQTRSKIGVMFGSPETTPGGKAMSFLPVIECVSRKPGESSERGSHTTERSQSTSWTPSGKRFGASW